MPLDSKTVNLKKPVMSGTEEVTKVDIREPDSGSLRGLELFSILRMDVTQVRKLMPRISNLTENTFDQLGAADLLAVNVEVAGFFGE